MNDVCVRSADRSDRSVLLEFHLALYGTYRASIMPEGGEMLYAYRDFETVLREDLDSMLRNPATSVLIAEEGASPLGYITGRIESQPRRVLPRRGVVEDWFVLEAARGRGAGKLLFERLSGIFRDSKCDLIESATWAFNDSARRAHMALGFQETEIKYRMRLE